MPGSYHERRRRTRVSKPVYPLTIANKILGVLEYGPLKEEMSRNSTREVGHINWDCIADETHRLYQSVMN